MLFVAELAIASQAMLAEEELRRKQKKYEAEAKTEYILKQVERPTTMIYATNSTGDTVVFGVRDDRFDKSLSELLSDYHVDKNLKDVLSDLGSLLLEDDAYDEDFLKPSKDAISFAWQLLDKAGKQLEGNFPSGTIYPDGSGGLRLEWISPEKELRLSISPTADNRSYIYYEFVDKYDADYNVSASNLANWLRWFNSNGRGA